MSDRLPGTSTSNPIEYRGFLIHRDPPPIPDRRFDWCGTWENGDGEPNCYGRTLDECKADIDRWHEEEGDDSQFGVGA